MIIKMEELVPKITQSNYFNSVRKLMNITDGFLSNNGTGIIIKFGNKFYLLCLYHSFSDDKNEIIEDKVKNLRVFYKTYLGNFDKKNIKPEEYLLFPEKCLTNTIQHDLMLSDEVVIISLSDINQLQPIGYLDFDDPIFEVYLLSDKEPIENELLFACGFPLNKNEVEIDFTYDDDFNTNSEIKKVSHEVAIFGGVCIKDEIGFAIQKQDTNSSFGENINGTSGGIVIRMKNNNEFEWVGVIMRGNEDLIRFIPYDLFAKSAVKGILDMECPKN